MILSSKCNKLVPFTSSYRWTYGGDGSSNYLSKINYNNSFISSKVFSGVFTTSYVLGSNFVEIGSDGLLNFNTSYYYDSSTCTNYVNVKITGVYKKCNYSSDELDYLTSYSSTASVKVNKTGSSEEFHKLLDSNPNLKKKYLQIKAKLGK